MIDKVGLDTGRFLRKKKIDFVGHVSRFGLGSRETHLVKQVILWRPIQWWRLQQKTIEAGHPFVHPRAGEIKRFDDQFPRNGVNKFSAEALKEQVLVNTF